MRDQKQISLWTKLRGVWNDWVRTVLKLHSLPRWVLKRYIWREVWLHWNTKNQTSYLYNKITKLTLLSDNWLTFYWNHIRVSWRPAHLRHYLSNSPMSPHAGERAGSVQTKGAATSLTEGVPSENDSRRWRRNAIRQWSCSTRSQVLKYRAAICRQVKMIQRKNLSNI